jgi:hypothetical protein
VSRKQKAGQRSREYWVGLVGKFEQSGLSQRIFCESQGVRESALRYWLYRLRRERKKGPNPLGRFVQVVPSTTASGTTCKLRLGNAELTFSELPPARYVGELLRLMDR